MRSKTAYGGIPISKKYLRHVWTLVFLVLALAAALCLYFTDMEGLDFTTMSRKGIGRVFLCAVWAALVAVMLSRLVPNRRITMGARKHYSCSYRAAPLAEEVERRSPAIRKRLNRGAVVSALAWALFNTAVFLAQSVLGVLTPPAAVVVMLAYAVCGMVCTLFLCPFRLFFMRNRCCAVCRIHNWDCLMVCTPMVLFPSAYSLSLLALAVAVLLRWEIALRRKPHFFVEESNENLRCANCEERICHTRLSSRP